VCALSINANDARNFSCIWFLNIGFGSFGQPNSRMCSLTGFPGKTYPSLSKVAFAITGSRWSGPRFFGLDQPPSERRP
jgi:hypothetical protein